MHQEALIKQYEDEMQISKPVVIRTTVDIKPKPSSASSSPTPSPSGRAGGFEEWTTVAGPAKKKNGKSKKKKGTAGDTSLQIPGGASPSTISPAISPRGGSEDVEQRVLDLFEDYISSGDARDTANAVRELKAQSPQQLYRVVELGISSTIDKKENDRELVGKLFTALALEDKILQEEHFVRG